MSFDGSELTITLELLKTPCLLVHIPRSRIGDFSHHVTQQFIATPPRSFLSITTNEIEMTIIADEDSMDELADAAREDALLWRQRKHSSRSLDQPLEISEDRWSVFVVETHDLHAQEQPVAAGNRVRELSAPLAKAGISILYQSSYMNDFILVQTRRVEETINILIASGYSLNYEDDYYDPYRRSVPTSPSDSISHYSYFSAGTTSSSRYDDYSHSGSFSGGTRPRSVTSLSALSAHSPTVLSMSTPSIPKSKPPALTLSMTELSPNHKLHNNINNSNSTNLPSSSSKHNLSISLLPATLAMVGLTEETSHIWALKLIKLFIYPKLLHPALWTPRDSGTSANHQGSHKVVTDGIASLALGTVSTLNLSAAAASGGGGGLQPSDGSALLGSSSDDRARQSSRSHSSSTSASSPSARSRPPSPSPSPSVLRTREANLASSIFSLPFASFTRTSQGTSLTTDIYSLYNLFPTVNERQLMVRCADEMDDMGRGTGAGHTWQGGGGAGGGVKREKVPEDVVRAVAMEQAAKRETTFMCLQVDLREFELDKHGVVNRLSEILYSNDINHLFSSTFKTANVLVACEDAPKAVEVLTIPK